MAAVGGASVEAGTGSDVRTPVAGVAAAAVSITDRAGRDFPGNQP